MLYHIQIYVYRRFVTGKGATAKDGAAVAEDITRAVIVAAAAVARAYIGIRCYYILKMLYEYMINLCTFLNVYVYKYIYYIHIRVYYICMLYVRHVVGLLGWGLLYARTVSRCHMYIIIYESHGNILL